MSNPVLPQGSFPDGEGEPTGEGLSEELLIKSAGEVQSYTSDGQTYTERSLKDLIELDKYLKNKPRNVWGSMNIAKAVPPDALGN